MTSAGLPDLARRSRIAFAAAVVLTLMVALIEVPAVNRPPVKAPVQAFSAAA